MVGKQDFGKCRKVTCDMGENRLERGSLLMQPFLDKSQRNKDRWKFPRKLLPVTMAKHLHR